MKISLAALVFLPPIGVLAAEEGKVTLPLSVWESMLMQVENFQKPVPPGVPLCPVERRLEGSFRKGLLEATLTARFQVLDTEGHVRVPLLDAGVALGEVLLDGRRTSLLKEGSLYTLGVDTAGPHEVRLRFFWGREQDRFARRINFQLPGGGVTSFRLLIPESGIEPQLAHGALVVERAVAAGTELEGSLDASGVFDLSWSRKLTHREAEAFRMEARINALFNIQPAVVSGRAVFEVKVLQGETDRLDLRLPPETEILRVEGDEVLQWLTDAQGGGRLTVLLRYLVERSIRLEVSFQFPVETGKSVALRLPLPPNGVAFSGALGVQGPAGLKVSVASSKGARELTLRDVPPELAELTSSPILFAFEFGGPPEVALNISRHQEVELTSTIIDELAASSVLLEDGTEVTKLKARMRNNTRQYLKVKLPAGAQLTHSLIDGLPVRPALVGQGAEEALLFPLRQSEKIGRGMARSHVVREGETLSEIANIYFSNPAKWQAVLDNNRDQIAAPEDIYVGQVLRIPLAEGVTVEESSFVIELAYTRQGEPLGSMGRVALRLPELDVPAAVAVWHLFFPHTLEPLSFSANLTQYSAIRYDPFRRLRDFLHRVFWERQAFAGGKYMNVLRMRKEIYYSESGQRGPGEVVLSSFPLVGERYRFRRSQLGSDTPRLSITYLDRDAVTALRWVAFLAALGMGLWLFAGRRRPLSWWLVGGALLLLLLVLAHFVLGVHRRLLWGLDLALLVGVLRPRLPTWWKEIKEKITSPWRVIEWLTFKNLALLVGWCLVLWFVLFFPLLLSSTAAVVLFVCWRRKRNSAVQEVAHA